MRTVPGSLAVLVPLSLLITGCSGGNPTANLEYRPPALNLKAGRLKPIRLPQDDPFSLHRAPTQRTPRLTGDVAVEAEAHPDGTAQARTQIVAEGEGWAGFQVGHAVRNETIRQIVLDVRIELDYAARAESLPQPLIGGASVALDVLARDQNNRRLRQLSLLSHDSEDGPLDAQSTRTVHWRLTLAPGDTVTLYVGGQTAGKLRYSATDPQRTLRSELRLRRLRMILTPELPAGDARDAQGQDVD